MLALTVIPLLKRPEPLPAKRDPRIIEIAALKAQIDELNRRIENLGRDIANLRLERDYWRGLPPLAQAAMGQAMQAMQAMQAQQFGVWHGCTCVPERASILRGQADG